jgi:hypothetical protein
MGGNGGMNAHLSELLSWLLEPLADAMMGKSSEVISDEDLKNKIDNLNLANKDWKPETEKEDPIGEQEEMTSQVGAAPGLCGCEECERDAAGDESSEAAVVVEEHGDGAHSVGEVQDGLHRVGEQRDDVHSGGVADDGKEQQREYITNSVSRRGNRNRSLLLRERREQLRQKRTNRFKQCDRVSSKNVSQKWIQDRSKAMVIIGSDAVSLYPSITKLESSDEVARAVMETDLRWEGVDWKEAVRFIVLGRDDAWCRSSKLARVLPHRRYRKGTRPGFTGSGPLGAEAGDEKQWDFGPSPALTEVDKKMVMSEVLRLATEIMFETHLYNFNGKSYKQREGGPIGLRSTCALSRVVMGRWDMKWNDRMTANNIVVEDDGRLGRGGLKWFCCPCHF